MYLSSAKDDPGNTVATINQNRTYHVVDVTELYKVNENNQNYPIVNYKKTEANIQTNKQTVSVIENITGTDTQNVINNIGITKECKVVIFIHGFNFKKKYAEEVFYSMINKIIKTSDINTKYKCICVLWNSSANDKNENKIIRQTTEVLSNLATNAVKEEVKKIGNSGLIWERYIEDLERVTNSFRSISWLINDIAKESEEVHLIGHSMGCLAVLNSLSFMCHDYKTLSSTYYNGPFENGITESKKIVNKIRNVFMIAPDVSTSIFRHFVIGYMHILENLNKFVIYANNEDVAIYLSKLIRIHNSRLGCTTDAVNILNTILKETTYAVNKLNTILKEKYFNQIKNNINKIDILDIIEQTRLDAIGDLLFIFPRSLLKKDYPESHNYYNKDDICDDIKNVIYDKIFVPVRGPDPQNITPNNKEYVAGGISTPASRDSRESDIF